MPPALYSCFIHPDDGVFKLECPYNVLKQCYVPMQYCPHNVLMQYCPYNVLVQYCPQYVLVQYGPHNAV